MNGYDPVRDILRPKTWFGFDLDDTLHEFRNASRAATTLPYFDCPKVQPSLIGGTSK